MQEIYVIGAGGHGKVVASVFEAARAKVLGFLDDDPSKTGKKISGIPVLGKLDAILAKPGSASAACVIAIGDNAARKRTFVSLTEKKIPLVSALHPSCVVHPTVIIGNGTVAMAGVILNPDSRVGDNVILNTGVIVDHDCLIESHAHLAPGTVLAGGVMVGEGAFLGVGVRVIPNVRIGAWAVVGAGGVVLEDVPPGKKVAGVPARPI